MTETPDPGYLAALNRRQRALQQEARDVLADLCLIKALERAGRTDQIGSSVTGLMVWRDVDVAVETPRMRVEDAFTTLLPILCSPTVTSTRYVNEADARNPTGRPEHDRYFFVIYCTGPSGREWKIDVAFWRGDAPRHERDHCKSLSQKLTPETRQAILWIKDVWHRLPTYRRDVVSVDIYDAVVEHGVRTPAEFDRYLTERGKPARSSIAPGEHCSDLLRK